MVSHVSVLNRDSNCCANRLLGAKVMIGETTCGYIVQEQRDGN